MAIGLLGPIAKRCIGGVARLGIHGLLHRSSQGLQPPSSNGQLAAKTAPPVTALARALAHLA
jgi:hypothetical protein